MDDVFYKEVRFDIYCKTCKYKDFDQASDECNECLNTPARENTKRPLKWEEKE